MAGSDDEKVAAVDGGYGREPETFSDGNDAGVDEPQAEIGVSAAMKERVAALARRDPSGETWAPVERRGNGRSKERGLPSS